MFKRTRNSTPLRHFEYRDQHSRRFMPYSYLAIALYAVSRRLLLLVPLSANSSAPYNNTGIK